VEHGGARRERLDLQRLQSRSGGGMGGAPGAGWGAGAEQTREEFAMTGNDRAAVIGYLVLAGEELKRSAKQAREGGTMAAVRAHLRAAVDLLDEARAHVGWQETFDDGESEPVAAGDA
jgi:hypothetical protein